MIRKNIRTCPKCNNRLQYYDTAIRTIREGNGKIKKIYLQRFKCSKCNNIHRELPDNVYPYKHYDLDVIYGVVNGYITSDTLGYEDYPCELTMLRWKRVYSLVIR